jgi:acetyl-CoA carboxylase biotin carboxyl carrier protein
METETIKELMELISGTDITELCYEKDGLKISIKRGTEAPKNPQIQNMITPPALPEESTPESDESKMIPVKSPIVGTFYRSPSPDSSPFVNIGDSVKKGQVLCVIEAMKLMNEIESETEGTIARILVENNTAVEYGEILFYIEAI